ncbi:hypothetical protein C5B85_17680 [Pseudoclavibacter sp. AY1F1]|uniref:hypothetical protein n=1 Tax=Pseudoclavibacter sp. AY1F1 TaxID=2080583 RepID=UPI000CE7B1C4|nr:hypothetical protein [Pseudoclavibacter sp. AY1F1]PPF42025.1 hypothetical protein C5B85_17680 [Pseudoclavibacter sp. AY1F1]
MCRVDGDQFGSKSGAKTPPGAQSSTGAASGRACKSNADYDHIVERDTLPRPRAGDSWTRERGYAVKLSGDDWLFFTALEPAYAYGRAGRMSTRATSWSVREAVIEVKLDQSTGHEERTLHLLFGADHAYRSKASDRKLLSDFVAGVTGRIAHWPISA